MTLTELEETQKACCKSMQPTVETEPAADGSVGLALREALWQALDQGRLTVGVVECAQLLERDPFSVMLCVMPVAGRDDFTALIQRTLLKALCHEYHIRLIEVDSVSKLGKVLQGRTLTPPPPPPPPPPTGLLPSPSPYHPHPQGSGRGCPPGHIIDVSCLLVQRVGLVGSGEGGCCSAEERKKGGEADEAPVVNSNPLPPAPPPTPTPSPPHNHHHHSGKGVMMVTMGDHLHHHRGAVVCLPDD